MVSAVIAQKYHVCPTVGDGCACPTVFGGHQVPLAKDCNDLPRVLVAQRWRFGMVRADSSPRIAVLVHLLPQMPGRDVHVLARLHQRAPRDTVLREHGQMHGVDLHDAVIGRAVGVLVHGGGTVMRFLPGDGPQYQRIDLLIIGRLVEAVGACKPCAQQRDEPKGDGK